MLVPLARRLRLGGRCNRRHVHRRRPGRGRAGPRIGGISDRRGRLYPIRIGLVLVAVVALGFAILTAAPALVILVAGASLAASAIYAPGIALVSDRAEANGMPQTLAFGLMNTAWAIGAMTGPAAGGRRDVPSAIRCPT